jgi:hypothetical protein
MRVTARSRSDPLADEMYVESDFTIVDAVRRVAERRGLPMAEIHWRGCSASRL